MFRCGFVVLVAVLVGTLGCASGNECTNCEANAREASRPEPDPIPPAPSVEPEPVAEPEPEPASPEPEAQVEPYGSCFAGAQACRHGDTPHCLLDDAKDPTMGFCTSNCGSTQECPRAPFGGTAAPNCLSLDETGGKCVLDCLYGQSCPADMVCLPFGVCGYVTDEAENPYDRCDRCPEASVGCLETALGEVCLPPCTDECPAARAGDAFRACIDVEGQFGCALACDLFRDCPVGMVCTQVGYLSLCLWPSADPCAALDCGRDADCAVLGGQPVCVCEADLAPDEERDCVDPCSLLECHPTARCEAQGSRPRCVCDPPEVMTANGRCEELPAVDPCDPNPCQGAASRCVVRDGAAQCECPDPGDTPPECDDSECTANHTGGDAYEPNDCPEDATVVGAGDASLGLSRVDADFGPELDDVDRYRLLEQVGWYWILLEAPLSICDLPFAELPPTAPFGGFRYGLQARADDWIDWACRYDSALMGQTAYSIGAVHFVTGPDLPSAFGDEDEDEFEPFLEPTRRSVADRFEMGSDVDSFAFEAELPLTLEFTGQRAVLTIEAHDVEGAPLLGFSVECGFALEPAPCAQLYGTGPATVRISVRESEQAEQRELDAWHLGW